MDSGGSSFEKTLLFESRMLHASSLGITDALMNVYPGPSGMFM